MKVRELAVLTSKLGHQLGPLGLNLCVLNVRIAQLLIEEPRNSLRNVALAICDRSIEGLSHLPCGRQPVATQVVIENLKCLFKLRGLIRYLSLMGPSGKERGEAGGEGLLFAQYLLERIERGQEAGRLGDDLFRLR